MGLLNDQLMKICIYYKPLTQCVAMRSNGCLIIISSYLILRSYLIIRFDPASRVWAQMLIEQKSCLETQINLLI